jgi:hypothetical protein
MQIRIATLLPYPCCIISLLSSSGPLVWKERRKYHLSENKSLCNFFFTNSCDIISQISYPPVCCCHVRLVWSEGPHIIFFLFLLRLIKKKKKNKKERVMGLCIVDILYIGLYIIMLYLQLTIGWLRESNLQISCHIYWVLFKKLQIMFLESGSLLIIMGIVAVVVTI